MSGGNKNHYVLIIIFLVTWGNINSSECIVINKNYTQTNNTFDIIQFLFISRHYHVSDTKNYTQISNDKFNK